MLTAPLPADLNNRTYSNLLSGIIQEHLELIRLDLHVNLPDHVCYTCKLIKTMYSVGTLSGVIYDGLYENDLRPYDPNSDYGYLENAWWDCVEDTVNEEWLKKNLL